MVRKSLLLLNKLKSLSHQKLGALVSYFDDIDEILYVKSSSLFEAGLKDKDVRSILSLRESKELDEELRLIERQGITVIDLFSKDYPFLLKQICHPPLLLYLKGNRSPSQVRSPSGKIPIQLPPLRICIACLTT